MHPHRLTTRNDAKTVILAGNAIFTIVSVKTGKRFTFKVKMGDIKRSRDGVAMWFVNLLTGPDNIRDYTPLGCIRSKERVFATGRWCKVPTSATSYKAFEWVWKLVKDVGETSDKVLPLPEGLELWHEGRCGRCGRKLTVPSSIELGIGPECLTKTSFY